MIRITDEEFRRVGDKRSAVMMAIGAASVCWVPDPGPGVFDSERAADLADDLIRYLAVPDGLSAEEAKWLDTLIDSATPAHPGSPADWEGLGRAHAKKILRRVITGGAPEPAADTTGIRLVGSDR
jgi:hypothetical protein